MRPGGPFLFPLRFLFLSFCNASKNGTRVDRQFFVSADFDEEERPVPLWFRALAGDVAAIGTVTVDVENAMNSTEPDDVETAATMFSGPPFRRPVYRFGTRRHGRTGDHSSSPMAKTVRREREIRETNANRYRRRAGSQRRPRRKSGHHSVSSFTSFE